MDKQKTRLTGKNQTTVPKNVRDFLKVKSGEEVEWHVIKGMVVINRPERVKNPVEFLTSQIKLNLDAVKLVREAREDFR